MKTVMLAGFAFAFALAGSASDDDSGKSPMVRVSGSVDYTWSSMEQLNSHLSRGFDVTKSASGIAGMLEFDVAITKFLLLAGVRGGYLACLSSNATYNYLLYNQKKTINSSLIPLELGLGLHYTIPTSPFSLMAGVYGGYGFAFATIKNDISALGQSGSFTQPYDGGGFVAEFLATINLKLISILSINVHGGYRYANITQMKQSTDVSFNAIPGISIPIGSKGDVLKDSDNNDLAFDFSGVILGAGLSLGF